MAKLTPIEHMILTLVGEGQSNHEIACFLAMNPATVSYHLERIYQKLEVTNSEAAIQQATRLELIRATLPSPSP
jgi:DNA-binding NarL/FixJ family response regulator